MRVLVRERSSYACPTVCSSSGGGGLEDLQGACCGDVALVEAVWDGLFLERVARAAAGQGEAISFPIPATHHFGSIVSGCVMNNNVQVILCSIPTVEIYSQSGRNFVDGTWPIQPLKSL